LLSQLAVGKLAARDDNGEGTQKRKASPHTLVDHRMWIADIYC
jgi:hypothetical protein